MFNFSRINCLLAKENFHNQTWRLFLNNAGTNPRRNDKIAKFSSSNTGVNNRYSHIRCRYTESVVPLSQSLCSLYSQKINFIPGRNFSKSNTQWSWMQSNQDKERLKNYMFLGSIVLSVIFVIYMFQTMEYHQDYVHIEPSENKK